MTSKVDCCERELDFQSSKTPPSSVKKDTISWHRLTSGHLRLLFVCIMITSLLICGCSNFEKGRQIRSMSREANDFFNQGKYEASLSRYRQIAEKYPAAADRALFEMGIVYAHPGNENKDYLKALECYRKLVNDYPDSVYRRDSQMMIFQLNNVIIKDKIIAAQQAQIETFRQEVKTKEYKISALQERVEALEQKNFELRTEPADKVLIEKKERRLTLLSKGEVIKRYKIALGGNPVGPKERQGDSKTPEGIYVIDSRNRDSGFHLSLHISYPNEKDKLRARELGVSPGGDIMIHGIKNGFDWIGSFHSQVDWTEGCIAVTDEEIEEIDRLVPDGTIVEIRP